jgi:hypothetical protein
MRFATREARSCMNVLAAFTERSDTSHETISLESASMPIHVPKL